MLKKNLIVALMFTLSASGVFAQSKFFTKTGQVNFFSKASLEDIEAKNKTVTAVLDSKSGAMQFAIQMKGFEFEKQLMQQHFNENYVESDKFPKAEFKGTIVNNSDINYDKEGTYPAKVKGKLTIHGVTQDIETNGTVKIDGENLKLESAFNILLSDYDIKIPSVVKEKISNSIKINVDTKLEKLKG
ncbi:MAG: YceI family protein [Flavisolibacter sp.]|jgi:polyisoprenoid-binding protein YceI